MEVKKPEALRLADWLEDLANESGPVPHASAELRRLHAVNAQLLEVLQTILVVKISRLEPYFRL
jgi:hypothetical protein